jgi:hypothetical protein
VAARSYAEAVATLEPVQHLAARVPNCAGHLGYAHARLGHRAEAERLLQMLLDRFSGAWAPWVDVAAIYSGLGDVPKTIEWLQRGCRGGCFDSLFIRDDPRFVNLRGDLRFERLLETAGAIAGAAGINGTA